MKRNILILICIFIMGVYFGISINAALSRTYTNQNSLIKAYQQYYSNTEVLLDELDSAYNWVDGYDNYDYYSSKAKIDSLTNNIQ